MSDISKQIILSLQLRGAEKVQAAIKPVIASLSQLDKSRSVTNLSKNFQTLSKSTSTMGETMKKSFDKIGVVVGKVATENLSKLEKEFNKTTQRMERTVKVAEERIKRGDRPEKIQRTQQNVERRTNAAVNAGDAWSQQQASLPPPPNGPNGPNGGGVGGEGLGNIKAFGGAMAIVTALAKISQAQEEIQKEKMQNVSYLGGQLQQRRFARYSGDTTEQVMELADQSVSKSKEYAKSQTEKHNANTTIWTTIGALTGGFALGSIGALLGGPPGAIIGASAGATAGAALGGGKYFLNGGAAKFEQESYEEHLEKEKRLHDTAKFQAYYSEHADSRYKLNRQMGMTSDEALNERLAGYGNLVNEQETGGMQLGFRGTFGNTAAMQLTRQTGALARSQGMDLGAASGIMGGIGYGGVGGTANAQKNVQEMTSKAMAQGITDSGLIEIMEKAIAEMAKNGPGNMDVAGMMEKLAATAATGAGPGGDVTGRNVQNALNIQQAKNTLSLSGGTAGFMKMSLAAQIAPNDAGLQNYLSGMSAEQLQSLEKDPMLQKALGPEGIKRAKNMMLKQGVLAIKGHMIAGPAFNEAKAMADNGDYEGAADKLGIALKSVSGYSNLSPDALKTSARELLLGEGGSEKYKKANEAAMAVAKQDKRLNNTLNVREMMTRENQTPKQERAMFKALSNLYSKSDTSEQQAAVRSMIHDLPLDVRARYGKMKSNKNGITTEEEANVDNKMKGTAALDKDANAVGEYQGQAGENQRSSTPLSSKNLKDSTDNLKAALDDFVKKVQNGSGGGQSSTDQNQVSDGD